MNELIKYINNFSKFNFEIVEVPEYNQITKEKDISYMVITETVETKESTSILFDNLFECFKFIIPYLVRDIFKVTTSDQGKLELYEIFVKQHPTLRYVRFRSLD